jgi:diguanylate cyclase (GGDEF)-like protein
MANLKALGRHADLASMRAGLLSNRMPEPSGAEEPRSPGAIRHLFRRRAVPYAGFDLDRSKRLGGVLWLAGAAGVLILLPLAPPTAAIGSAGWLVAAGVVGGCALTALIMLMRPERVGAGALLATSYAAVAMIAVLEWLAGGHGTPYHQLYLLSVVYTACVHPPRRVLIFLVVFVAFDLASFTYSGLAPSEVGDAILQIGIDLGLAMLGMVLMEGVRAQRSSLRQEGEEALRLAEVDSLTGLGNRRRFMADLEVRVAEASSQRPLGVVLFDLDGFKAYNDTFGHPAGDALLVRLADALSASVGDLGSTYRMGGDEFCVLVGGSADTVRAARAAASRALSAEGEGFSITASSGVTLLPADTNSATGALRIADRRMYANKARGRTSAGKQTTDVLLKVLSERNSALALHLDGVTDLCEAVGRQMQLPEEIMVPLLQTASLHDVGKAAIPDAILEKPGPLSEDEWEFMRRHTVIGERILSAAPALAEAARSVRSSHERLDGAGYPDRLRGTDIPLVARIVFVCDAYDAMTSPRSYRAPMAPEAALAELKRCAGSQFDQAVVDAFCAVMSEANPATKVGGAIAVAAPSAPGRVAQSI